MKLAEYKDDEGLTVIVEVENDADINDVSYGIPVSVDLRQLFPDYPVEWLLRVERALFDAGYRTLSDYQQKHKKAWTEINRALNGVRLRLLDASTIVEFALTGKGGGTNGTG